MGPGVPPGYEADELYLRTSDGKYTPLLTVKPPNRPPGQFGAAYLLQRLTEPELEFLPRLRFSGASADFGRVFFEANDALTADAAEGSQYANNLYEWSGGTLHLVNILPTGSTVAGAWFGAESGANFVAEGNAYGSEPNLSNAISADGSRVFWTDANSGNLYVRLNGTSTVQVDAAVGGGGAFAAASTDGSVVFFTKNGDLYQYQLNTGQTLDLGPRRGSARSRGD